jgi:hypothetical protein
MDHKTNDKGPSSTEGRAMKVGDKVWVLCEVEDLDFEGSTVGYRGYRFFAYSKDCKPVEPEADKTQDTGDILDGCCGWNRAAETVQVVKQPLTPTSDPVNPSHYKQGPAETIDIIEAAIAKAPNNKAAGLHWQVLKYALRCWFKNGIEDLKKARWYLDRLIQEEESK